MNKLPQKLVIASGKGGVGKSMLASSLAILFVQDGKKIIAADCDVDAPNLAIWVGGIFDWDKSKKITTLNKPKIDLKKCNDCGKCFQNCRFNALKIERDKARLNYVLCEGCGVCQIVCPQKAIKLAPVKNAEVLIKNKTKYGFPLISAQLFPGESSLWKIIRGAKTGAEKFQYDIMILDFGELVSANAFYLMLTLPSRPLVFLI